eukprot:gene714-777_t
MGATIHDGKLTTETKDYCYPMFCEACDTNMMGYFEEKVCRIRDKNNNPVFSTGITEPVGPIPLDTSFAVFCLLQLWRCLIVRSMNDSKSHELISSWRNHVHLFLAALSQNGTYREPNKVLHLFTLLRCHSYFHMHFFIDTMSENESFEGRALATARFNSFQFDYLWASDTMNFWVRAGRFHFCLCQHKHGDWICQFDSPSNPNARFPGYVGTKPVDGGCDSRVSEILSGVAFPDLSSKKPRNREWKPCKVPLLLQFFCKIRAYHLTIAQMTSTLTAETITSQYPEIASNETELKEFLMYQMTKQPALAISCVADRDIALIGCNLRKCEQIIGPSDDPGSLLQCLHEHFGLEFDMEVPFLSNMEAIRAFSEKHKKSITMLPAYLSGDFFDGAETNASLFLAEDTTNNSIYRVGSLCGCRTCGILCTSHGVEENFPCASFEDPTTVVKDLFNSYKASLPYYLAIIDNRTQKAKIVRHVVETIHRIRKEIRKELFDGHHFCDVCLVSLEQATDYPCPLCRLTHYCSETCCNLDKESHELDCKTVQIITRTMIQRRACNKVN